MWLIANGAPKNGSTWILNLVKATRKFAYPPEHLRNPVWKNPSVSADKAEQARDELGLSAERYMSKQHWTSHADFLQAPGIKVINVIRDIRDVVVSYYYHSVKYKSEIRNISAFVEADGPAIVQKHCRYHLYWIDAALNSADGHESYFVSSYEHMHADIETAARQLYEFVGLDLSDGEATRLIESIRFENWKNTGPGEFLRKGKPFGYRDELTRQEEDLIIRAGVEHDLLGLKEKIAVFRPQLALYLEQTDVGLAQRHAQAVPAKAGL